MTETLRAWRDAGLLNALDHRLALGLSRLSGASDEKLTLAFALVSRQLRSGHLYLDLSAARSILEAGPWEIALDSIPEASAWRATLELSPAVGAPGDSTPLILQGDRLYLHRYWDHQDKLARALRARSAPPTEAIDPDVSGLIRELFPGVLAEDPLLHAARAATASPLHIIVGGPGTGKTSAVVRILALWASLAMKRGEPPPRVALAAPTGKARARLEESIAQARASLDVDEQVREIIPSEAQTIHRLLRWRPTGQPRCRFNASRQLPIDALVIDEASMVDLAMMRRLLDACPPNARVILLGDPNQLASVEAGSVLADICDAANEVACPLNAQVTRLQRSYRYQKDSGVGQLAEAIVCGDGMATLNVCRDERFPSASSEPASAATEPAPWLEHAIERYAALPRAQSPEEALQELGTHRILCAHRRGPLGVEDINRRIEAALRARGDIQAHPGGYHGQPIIITQNDPNNRLANGDVGVLWRNADGTLHAYLPDEQGGLRAFHPSRIPPHATSWAMTIHKSQGSEFSEVTVVLPAVDSPILSRDLLYTGVTRARRAVHIVGDENIIRDCVGRRTERSSGLADALRLS